MKYAGRCSIRTKILSENGICGEKTEIHEHGIKLQFTTLHETVSIAVGLRTTSILLAKSDMFCTKLETFALAIYVILKTVRKLQVEDIHTFSTVHR